MKRSPLYVILIIYMLQPITSLVSFPIITMFHSAETDGHVQMGDGVMLYCLAKILSMKYNIPVYYNHFNYHDLFVFSDNEKADLGHDLWSSSEVQLCVVDDKDIIKNKNTKALFYSALLTKISYIQPRFIEKLKQGLRLKTIPKVFPLPQGLTSVTVHIRKGNGGGQQYDGEQFSLQEFDFDRSKVKYHTDIENYPFDWRTYLRKKGRLVDEIHYPPFSIDFNYIDRIPNHQTQFPPDQFYIDQIKKISTDLQDRPLFIQLVTDDRDPQQLLERLIKLINKPNITFHYEDNRHLSYRDKIHQDLYMMSRTDGLIRGQSGFARVAELLGNHRLIVYPLNFRWDKNKLIMTEIVIKGSL